MDIAEWLRRLGLERYEATFRNNDIDVELLRHLTSEDLKELGVASIGHRRRLLDAIAALRAEAATWADEPPSEPSAARPSAASAERRQLTVMFVDLVGSTALSARLDPEELCAVMRAYHDACAAVLAEFEGHVAKYLGDGVLAYFGWPAAQEDAPERAVRAGLAMVEAVARLVAPSGEALAARVGIATGLVVVGDLIGEGSAREEAVVGETPNLAARLQQFAEPGSVVVGDHTRRLLGGMFALEDQGARVLHGFDKPVRVWRVVGEGGAGTRFEGRRAAGLTPLVGRDHELALLLERWQRARDGEGQVVLLMGEPGVGKSRMVEALRERLADEEHHRLAYQCSPQHTHTALHPLAARIEEAAGFRHGDSAERRLDKLEALLAREIEAPESMAPLFAAVLGVPTGGRYPPLGLTPEQQKAETLAALAAHIEALAASRPFLLVFEDLQWADPTSLELLELLVGRIEALPVLAILTARPEFTPSWLGRGEVTMLTLGRLSRREATLLAERVAGKPLPEEVLEQIVATADGVALFVEELTKAVLESGLLEDLGERYAVSGPLPSLAVPPTLQDSLMARLDRLASAKEIAQMAACLGREFHYEMLAAVLPMEESRLRAALHLLTASDLLVRRGVPPAVTYAFRHTLVQEAAYEALLRSRRREMHARIARTVEERYPELAAERPEWLAHHLTEAGLLKPAAERWLEAGRRAKGAYANREAVSHLRRCLETIAALPANEAVGEWKLEALVLLGDLASLADDLEGANRWYDQALTVAPDAATRARIENKRHRPRIAVHDGARLAFYEHGSGLDTLLLVSPLVYGLATFQPLVERLCQEFRIVTIESRGSGRSDPLTRPYPLSEHAKDVRAVIRALGDRPVIGVGISRGSNLLLRLAHAEPGLFDKLLTIGCPPSPSGQHFATEFLAFREQVQAALENPDLEWLARTHTSFMFPEPEMRELRRLVVQQRLGLPRDTLLSFFDPDPSMDVTGVVADIRVPTLVTHGRDDPIVRVAAAEHLVAQLPDARLYIFENKGHVPIYTATDEFCAVLRAFARTGTRAPDIQTKVS